MGFADIKDQEIPLRFLRNVLTRNRIPNGLLFWGPSGVGKRTTAIEMAKAIYCAKGDGDACGKCLPCRKIVSGNHPDLTTLAPLKKSRNIDVKAIDSVIELASLKPFEGEWRIFMIHEADRMGVPAQNHLLKTLEEPLGRSVFMLISEHPQRLLPTIRSRCQRIRFGRLRPETVAGLLRSQREVSEEQARTIAAVSQGQMSRALDLVDSEKREVVFDVIKRLNGGEDPLALAEEFSKYLVAQKAQIEASVKAEENADARQELSPDDLEQIREERQAVVDALTRRDIMEHLYLMETWYRDELVYSATGDVEVVFNQDNVALLEQAGPSDASAKIAAISKARLYLERFLNEERVFRDLFFALAS